LRAAFFVPAREGCARFFPALIKPALNALLAYRFRRLAWKK